MDRSGEEQAKQNGDVVCDGGDASEWKKVAELRAAVEVQDPAAKQVEAIGQSRPNECARRPGGMDRGGDEQAKQQKGHGGCDSGGDAAEWKKVAELRTVVVEAQDPAAKEEDDFMLRRFLRARDHSVGKASAMFLKYLAWKRAAKPNGPITDDEVRNELAQEKLYVQGHDKMGRPMVYLFGCRHIAAKRDINEFKRYVVYILDNTCAKLPAGQEKFAAVVDLKGFGYANCDVRAMLESLDIMQNNYPERLGRVLLIHVPYVFMAAWKMVYPFIDDNTKKKFVFVAHKDLDATLRDALDEHQLPEEFGGKLKLQGYNASVCN